MVDEEQVTRVIEFLDRTIQRVSDEAREHHRRARRERRYHHVFGTVIAVLSVATPALVTYQTQVAEPLFQFAAILLTAIAGAGTTLQATFRWGQRFRQTRLAALELDELESNTRLERDYIELEENPLERYHLARQLNESCHKGLLRAMRKQIETEVATVTLERESHRAAGPNDKRR